MMITADMLMEGMYGGPVDMPGKEKIHQIRLDLIDDLFSFEHPFDKSYMRGDGIDELTEQIRASGVLEPVILRKTEGGRYECLAGHRRRKAAGRAGLETIPAIIKECTDEEAMIIVTDTNLGQRDRILPSEKAKAYALQMKALKRQGKRSDLMGDIENEGGPSERKTARDLVGEANGVSPREISRYIRLISLRPELMDIVDDPEDGRLTVTSGVMVAGLDPSAQEKLSHLITEHSLKVNAKRAKRIMEEELLTQDIPEDVVLDILSGNKEEPESVKTIKRALRKASKRIEEIIEQEAPESEEFDEEGLIRDILGLIQTHLTED